MSTHEKVEPRALLNLAFQRFFNGVGFGFAMARSHVCFWPNLLKSPDGVTLAVSAD